MSEFQPFCQNGTPGLINILEWMAPGDRCCRDNYPSFSDWNYLFNRLSWKYPPGIHNNKNPGKKTISDIYICSLATADLVCIIGMPFLLHQWGHGGKWVFGKPLCTTIASLDTGNQSTCSAIMTTTSLDRYLALVQPFCLTHLRTKSKTLQVNSCLWVAPVILIFPVYTTSIPREEVMRLTKMVLALISVFVWELPEASPAVHKCGSQDGRTGCQHH